MRTFKSESIPDNPNNESTQPVQKLFPEPEPLTLNSQNPFQKFTKRSIKNRATLVAIIISTLPVLATGGIAYFFASQSITEKIVTEKQARVSLFQGTVNLFMRERFGDIQVMAGLDIFTDPERRASTDLQAKTEALILFQKTYKVYESIAVFDLKGDLIAQTPGELLKNHLSRPYIQAAIKANGPVISQPIMSVHKHPILCVYTASVIKDSVTGKPVGYIRARIPIKT